MNDAIEQLVDRFVDEILSLVREARTESRAAALDVVTTMLADMKPPAEPRKPAAPARTPAVKPSRPRASERQPQLTREAAREAAPATQRSPAPVPSRPAPSRPAPSRPGRPVDPPSAPPPPIPEREQLVLAAVQALGRATAAEIAGRSGQPNGSVAVTLRALVARGLVAKAGTGRGIEYSLVSAGRGRAMERPKHGEPAGKQAGDAPASGRAATGNGATTSAA